MKKVPQKYRMVIFILLMTFFIGLILSGIILVRDKGFVEGFFQLWITNFLRTWIIVIPVVVVVLPIVNYLTDKIVESSKS